MSDEPKFILPGKGIVSRDEVEVSDGLRPWLEDVFTPNLKPFPEPYSIRQAYYFYLPLIVNKMPQIAPRIAIDESLPDKIYQAMVGVWSKMFLAGKFSYKTMHLFDDSGASTYFYQTSYADVPPPDKQFVEYPLEVWVEKNASYNALLPLVYWNKGKPKYKINLVSGKGYAKSSGLEELEMKRKDDVEVILYLGDFDPAGVEMPKDIRRRLTSIGLEEIMVVHIGLQPAQVPEENDRRKLSGLRPNSNDKNYSKFIEEFGKDAVCYETQALTPQELRELVQDKIEQTIEKKGWERRTEKAQET
jgi:hypothetical protein